MGLGGPRLEGFKYDKRNKKRRGKRLSSTSNQDMSSNDNPFGFSDIETFFFGLFIIFLFTILCGCSSLLARLFRLFGFCLRILHGIVGLRVLAALVAVAYLLQYLGVTSG